LIIHYLKEEQMEIKSMEMGNSSADAITVKALEKAVLMLQEATSTLKKHEERITTLETEIASLKSQVGCIALDSNADHELNDYMQDAKNDPAFERPLTGQELAQRLDDYGSRRMARMGFPLTG
jgi:uncharacterized protein (DUF342 family)